MGVEIKKEVSEVVTDAYSYMDAVWDLALPQCKKFDYVLPGLSGELGELAEKVFHFDQYMSQHMGPAEPEEIEKFHKGILAELGDICWFLAAFTRSIEDTYGGGSLKEEDMWNLSDVRERGLCPLSRKDVFFFTQALTMNIGTIVGEWAKANRDQDPEIWIPTWVWEKKKNGEFVPTNVIPALKELFINISAFLNTHFNMGVLEVAQMNIQKLWDRRNRNVLQGSGDNR